MLPKARMAVWHVYGWGVALICLLGVAAPAGETNIIRLGVCLPLSGEYSMYGGLVLAGIHIRQEEYNSREAETGRRVELVLKDNQSDRDQAVRQVGELAREKVPLILGPCLSSHLPAMREEAVRLKVALLSPAASMKGLGRRDEWAFSVVPDDRWQGRVLARFTHERLRAKRVGILLNRSLPYAMSVADAFQKAFEKLGGAVVDVEPYNARADAGDLVDYGMLLERIRVKDPDVILLPTYFDEAAAIISQSTYLDLRARFIGGDGWAGETLLISAGNNLEGACYVSPYGPDDANPAMQNFMRRLDGSNDPLADRMSVLGYDALSLALAVTEKGGDNAAVRGRLGEIRNFPLATGELTFDPEFGVIKTTYIDQVFRQGDALLAKPIQVISAEDMLGTLKEIAKRK